MSSMHVDTASQWRETRPGQNGKHRSPATPSASFNEFGWCGAISAAESLLGTLPQLLEVLPTAIHICDARGRILGFNSRAAALWGRAPRLRDDRELYDGAFRIYAD